MAYVGTPIEVGNQFSSLVGKRFSGDASTTAFTLDVRANSALDIEVFVENVRQDPNSAYTVDGTTLTFTAAPPSGTNNVYVVHQAPTVASVSPTAGSVTASSFDNSVISGHTALAATPDDTDEFLISDAGTIKRIDYSHVKKTNSDAFLVYLSGEGSGQSVSNLTATIVALNTEVFDTDSKFNTSTYRFTPGVAGKYFIYASARFQSDADFDPFEVAIYKNGSSELARFQDRHEHYSTGVTHVVADLDSDDYIQLRVYQGSGGTLQLSGYQNVTFLGGFKLA